MIVSASSTVPQLTPEFSKPKGRPLRKPVVHAMRRGHLYLGLFLFPWAILYGATAFLFNHPTVFSDQPSKSFGSDAVAGTALDDAPSPAEQAEQVVKLLNEKKKPLTPYRVAGDAKYAREFAFATVRADGQTISVLVDIKNRQGTVRSAPLETLKKEPVKAPFAMVRSAAPRAGEPELPNADVIKLESPLQDRVKAAIPTILERTGFPIGEITVTSVPELTFPIEADGSIWTATYSATTGSLTGKLVGAGETPELSVRRFLTRLHLAHGYPGEQNSRWFWAVIVDAMAFVMCFWGLTGLIMWWQIKTTRKLGGVVLVLSAVAATVLGFGMYAAMSG